MTNILIVEDEHDLAKLVKEWLDGEHYNTQVVHNGDEALKVLAANNFDLMILDWLIPGSVDGMEICKRYRATIGPMPIIMLTAKSSVDEKEAGLDAGADDYLTKPFHLKELSARIRAILRQPPVAAKTVLEFGSISLDTLECKVRKNGEEVHLLPKEYKLLEFLMRHPKQVFSADLLLNRVWDSDAETCLDTVRGHIMRLRSKIDTPGEHSVIETVRGIGYKLYTNDA